MDITRTISKATEGLKNRINLMLARGVLTGVQDGGGLQTAQASLLEDEVRDGLERVQNYGFTSHPLGGAEVVVAFVGGNRDHGIILSVDDRRYRISLEAGEVAIYTDEGDYIKLKRDNNIEIKTRHLKIMAEDDVTIETKEFLVKASTATVFETPSLSFAGEGGNSATAKLTGSLTATNDLVANNGAVSLRAHGHINGGGSGTSGPPVGS